MSQRVLRRKLLRRDDSCDVTTQRTPGVMMVEPPASEDCHPNDTRHGQD